MKLKNLNKRQTTQSQIEDLLIRFSISQIDLYIKYNSYEITPTFFSDRFRAVATTKIEIQMSHSNKLEKQEQS